MTLSLLFGHHPTQNLLTLTIYWVENSTFSKSKFSSFSIFVSESESNSLLKPSFLPAMIRIIEAAITNTPAYNKEATVSEISIEPGFKILPKPAESL